MCTLTLTLTGGSSPEPNPKPKPKPDPSCTRPRLERLRCEYSFECDCARCALEKAIEEAESDDECCADRDDGHGHSHADVCCDDGHGEECCADREDGHGHSHGHSHGADDGGGSSPTTHGGAQVDMTYVSLFVLKHVCADCMGTMAPLPPRAVGRHLSSAGKGLVPSTTCVCNRCAVTRTEEEFLARCEAHFADDDED